MAKVQYRKSVSFAPEDFLLLKKLCEKLELPQTVLIAALVRTEAKKRRVRVTTREVEQFKQQIRDGAAGSRDDSQRRAAKLYPDAFDQG